MSRGVVLLLVAAVVATACAGDPATSRTTSPTPSSTTSTEASPTPSPTGTATEDSFAVPDDVDAAYVEAVLGELEATLAEAMTQFTQDESFDDPEASDLVAGIMTPDGAQTHLNLVDLVVQQNGWDVYADPVGVPTTSVEEVARADDDCIIARVARDEEPIYARYTREDVPRVWLVLRRLRDDQLGAEQAAEVNPTPWRIQFYGIKQGEDGPPDQECA